MGGLAHQILVGLFLKGPHKKKGIVPSFSENFRQEKPRLPQDAPWEKYHLLIWPFRP
jgi:hypothetical protein